MPRGEGASDGVDWLTAGPPPLSPARQRRRLAAVVVLGLLALAVAAVAFGPARPPDTGTATPTPGAQSPSPRPVTPSAASTRPARPLVVRDAGPFLRATSGWELFARSDVTVFRIDLRSGRVTATSHATLATNAPVAFVAGPEGAIVRPLDAIPGVAVADGQPARPLPGLLRTGGYTLPGPPGHVWVDRGPRDGPPTSMTLVRFDGTPRRVLVSGSGYFQSDGDGGLLMTDVGGVWEARPRGFRRITTGAVTAVGARHYLIANCDAAHVCRTYRYDRKTRSQRRLPLVFPGEYWPSGTISPDGRYAALFRDEGGGPPRRLVIVHLLSGRVVGRAVDPSGGPDPAGTLAWSPDGRWLAATLDGRLNLFEPASRTRVSPDLGLPHLVGLAGRTRGS